MNNKQSPYFHSPAKGCVITSKPNGNKWFTKDQYICQTHNTEICHCGWEYQHHYGYDNTTFSNRDKNIIKCYKKKMAPQNIANMFHKTLQEIGQIIEKYERIGVGKT